jgi:hypothetical protein
VARGMRRDFLERTVALIGLVGDGVACSARNGVASSTGRAAASLTGGASNVRVGGVLYEPW